MKKISDEIFSSDFDTKCSYFVRMTLKLFFIYCSALEISRFFNESYISYLWI